MVNPVWTSLPSAGCSRPTARPSWPRPSPCRRPKARSFPATSGCASGSPTTWSRPPWRRPCCGARRPTSSPGPSEMYFTREALEQSSGEIISAYRARRFARFARVGDLCCGIGGDAHRARRCGRRGRRGPRPAAPRDGRGKLEGVRPRSATFVLGDVTTVPVPDLDAAFFDPDRRADGKRHIRIREYVPAAGRGPGPVPGRVPARREGRPGVPWDELRTFDAEAEFISVGGELKECVLWFGPLKTTGRRATVLPAGRYPVRGRPGRGRRTRPAARRTCTIPTRPSSAPGSSATWAANSTPGRSTRTSRT